MNYHVLYNKELFLKQVTEKLGASPIDYAEKLQSIRKTGDTIDPHLQAGVLLLLSFCENNPPEKEREGEFFFRLIKRSQCVTQAGDLACPGGILHAKWDLPLKKLITGGLIPLLRNKAGRYARRRDSRSYHAIALFLANAVREAWEEISLNPFRMHFLGPLPSCSRHLLRRTIFPLVGYVSSNHLFRPNSEVERIVDIPVQAFFQPENYGTMTTVPDGGPYPSGNGLETVPCFIYFDSEGRENVLWGATFLIVINFLEIVFDFQIPLLWGKS